MVISKFQVFVNNESEEGLKIEDTRAVNDPNKPVIHPVYFVREGSVFPKVNVRPFILDQQVRGMEDPLL